MRDYSWKPNWANILNEADVHPHVTEEKANLFEAADGGSTEYEVLNWIYSTIRALKPGSVLETGAWEGLGTVALAKACKLNGFGKVHSLEFSLPACVRLHTVLEEEHLLKWAEIHEGDSLEFLKNTNLRFDIGFFDSDSKIRAEECRICLERGILNKIAVFHDTSPYRDRVWPELAEIQKQYRQEIQDLRKNPHCTGFFESTLSRGFSVLFFDFKS